MVELWRRVSSRDRVLLVVAAAAAAAELLGNIVLTLLPTPMLRASSKTSGVSGARPRLPRPALSRVIEVIDVSSGAVDPPRGVRLGVRRLLLRLVRFAARAAEAR